MCSLLVEQAGHLDYMASVAGLTCLPMQKCLAISIECCCPDGPLDMPPIVQGGPLELRGDNLANARQKRSAVMAKCVADAVQPYHGEMLAGFDTAFNRENGPRPNDHGKQNSSITKKTED